MKNLKQVITIIAVAVFMLGSFNANAQKLLPKDFEQIGIMHNKMLDEIYNKLSSSKIRKDEFKSILIQIYNKNMKGKYSEKDYKLGLNILRKLKTKEYIYKGKVYNNSLKTQLSKKVIFYLDKLSNLINSKLNLKDLLDKINKLETEINNDKLDNKDLIILYSATNVAKSSFSYWNKNYSKWEKLKSAIRKSPGTNIGGADVAGAVGGAVYAVGMNVIPGGGQVAYGATIISSGLGASAAAAVKELWDWIFE